MNQIRLTVYADQSLYDIVEFICETVSFNYEVRVGMLILSKIFEKKRLFKMRGS